MMWAGAIMCIIIHKLHPHDKMILILGMSLVSVVLITSTFEVYQEGKQSDVKIKL